MNCIIYWCTNKVRCKERCQKHYMDLYNWVGSDRLRRSDSRNAIDCWSYLKLPIWIGAKDWYALIDKEYQYLEKYKWSLDSNGYARANLWNRNITRLHRLIITLEEGKVTDHINRNKLDNRKCNLRIVTQKINSRNTSVRKKNNTWTLWIHYSKRDKLYCASWGNKSLWSSKDINVAKRLREEYEQTKNE